MQKQRFNGGTPVTPEWLNSIQNPTFEGSSEDVGHLPLPPHYEEKQQCKTIHVAGETTSVDLGDWPYNAVILVQRFMQGETPVYPRTLTVRCANTTGAIVVIPELDQDGALSIRVQGAGSAELATTSLKRGNIAIINAYDIVDEVQCYVRKLQTGDRVEFTNVLSSIFTVNYDNSHKAMVYIDSNFNLVISAANNSTINAVDFKLPLKAPSITSGTEGESGFFQVLTDNEKATFKIKGPETYNANFVEFNSKTGSFVHGHSYENDTDTIEMNNAALDLHREHSGAGYGYESHILFNKTINNSLNIVESTGTICTYSTDGGNFSNPPRKTEITPEGVVSYTYLDGQWTANT